MDTVAEVFEDSEVSGANGREKRPALDVMLKGVARRDFDLVAAWSVDRLGSSLQGLIGTLTFSEVASTESVNTKWRDRLAALPPTASS